MIELSFEYSGEFKAKERPRKGPAGNFYTPRETLQTEKDIGIMALQARAHAGIVKPHDGPVSLVITYSQPVPKTSKDKEILYKRNVSKPDIDNILKTILDACNKILYEDDCQVFSVQMTKTYHGADQPRVTIKAQLVGDYK